MTDRHTGYLITLETPLHEDDAARTLAALQQVKGVIDVRPIVASMEQMSGAVRMEHNWRKAIITLAEFGPGAIKENPGQ
jgi:hypothetical protein